MRHKIAGRKLSRPTAHRMLMLRGLVTDLLRHESIQTTEPKAKEAKRLAEKVITRGRKGDLSSRRRASAFLTDEKIVAKLFDEIGPRFENRPGGYTRIIKIGPRKGDASPMAVLELVD